MVHTPMVLTGETRETQEKHTPAKAYLNAGTGFSCSRSFYIEKEEQVMSFKRLIKNIPLHGGNLFGIVGDCRRLIATCEPVLNIYQIETDVPVLGKTAPRPKRYCIMLALCEDAYYSYGVNETIFQKAQANGYSLTGDILLKGNIIRPVTLDGLSLDELNPRDGLCFQTSDKIQIDFLLGLDTVEGSAF